MKPKVLGVIPARGSSKRFPNKNIRMLAGKPLIAWTIEAARKATRLTDFLVSSDALLIMDIAKNYGAPVPFKRPPKLATDTVRNIEVVAHALEFMETKRQQYGLPWKAHPMIPGKSISRRGLSSFILKTERSLEIKVCLIK